MAKALIIKGANFADNKVRTITLSDPVDCTGITLNKSTASITNVGSTETLVATVTPADTTDTVVWTSSDENVATVSDGVVTTVGVGTATITATCGNYSATCTVTSTHVINANTLILTDSYGMTDLDLSANPVKDFAYLSGVYSAYRTYASASNVLDGYKAFASYDNDYPDGLLYPLPIPKGATSARFDFPPAFLRLQYLFQQATVPCEYFTVTSPTSGKVCAKVLQGNTGMTVSGGTQTIAVPSNADSFVFGFRNPNGDAASVTGDVTVTFA